MQAPRSSGQTMANSEATNGRWKDYGVPSRIPDTSYGLEKGSNGTSRDCRIVDWSCVFPLKTDANTTSRERAITNKIAERHPGWCSTITASRTYASVQLQTRPVSHPRYKEKAVVVSGTASVTATRNPADISVKEVCEIPVFGRSLSLSLTRSGWPPMVCRIRKVRAEATLQSCHPNPITENLQSIPPPGTAFLAQVWLRNKKPCNHRDLSIFFPLSTSMISIPALGQANLISIRFPRLEELRKRSVVSQPGPHPQRTDR